MNPVAAQTPTPPEAFWLTKALAGAMALAIGGYGAYAWAQDGAWGKAVICLAAQLIAINAVIAARRAFARHTPDLLPWALIGLALICGYFSHEGLEHAWNQTGGKPIWPLATYALAAIDPFLFWAVDAVEHAPPRKSAEELAEEALQALRPPASAPAQSKAANGSRRFKALAGGLAAAAAMGAAAAPALASEPAQTTAHAEPVRPPSKPAPKRARAIPAGPDYARARELVRQGIGNAEVHRRTGVSIATCKRYRAALRQSAVI
jgi:hypothetical protein